MNRLTMKKYLLFLLGTLLVCAPVSAGGSAEAYLPGTALSAEFGSPITPVQTATPGAEQTSNKRWERLRNRKKTNDNQADLAFKLALWGLIGSLVLGAMGAVLVIIAVLGGAEALVFAAFFVLILAGGLGLLGLVGGILGLVAYKRLKEAGDAEGMRKAKTAAIIGLVPTALGIISSTISRFRNALVR